MTMASMQSLPVDTGAQRHALNKYRTTAKFFHWITVVLVAVMVSSAVIAKQLNDGGWSDTLFMLHKTTGVITLIVVLLRLCYRIMQWWTKPQADAQRRQLLHWFLYAVVVTVPLLGWAGISAFGSLDILPGVTLPAIWPKRWRPGRRPVRRPRLSRLRPFGAGGVRILALRCRII